MPKVSVMLPSYNHAQWIGDSIESVLNQTVKDIELVIVDDGSSDNSAEVIKKYAEQDDRIRYEIFEENKGAVHALRRCLELCTSDYLALTSSDDIWYEDKLEKQIPLLDNDPELGAVFGLATHVNPAAEPVKISNDVFQKSLGPKTKAEWMRFYFSDGNCICHHSILIRKKCYEEVGFYNPIYRVLPDMEMWVRLFHAYPVRVLAEDLIKFRRHDYNESGRYIGNRARSAMEYKQILKLFPKLVSSIAELKEIFPDKKFPIEDDRLVPFYWAQLALEVGNVFHKAFALDTLYTELDRPEVYEIIEKNGLYSHRRLSEDVVECDVFNSMEKTILKFPSGVRLAKRP